MRVIDMDPLVASFVMLALVRASGRGRQGTDTAPKCDVDKAVLRSIENENSRAELNIEMLSPKSELAAGTRENPVILPHDEATPFTFVCYASVYLNATSGITVQTSAMSFDTREVDGSLVQLGPRTSCYENRAKQLGGGHYGLTKTVHLNKVMNGALTCTLKSNESVVAQKKVYFSIIETSIHLVKPNDKSFILNVETLFGLRNADLYPREKQLNASAFIFNTNRNSSGNHTYLLLAKISEIHFTFDIKVTYYERLYVIAMRTDSTTAAFTVHGEDSLQILDANCPVPDWTIKQIVVPRADNENPLIVTSQETCDNICAKNRSYQCTAIPYGRRSIGRETLFFPCNCTKRVETQSSSGYLWPVLGSVLGIAVVVVGVVLPVVIKLRSRRSSNSGRYDPRLEDVINDRMSKLEGRLSQGLMENREISDEKKERL